MKVSVYLINKGVNRAVEFKGLKGAFIWFLFGAIGACLLIYAVLYIAGVNQYLSLLMAGGAGALTISKIFQLSRKYGEHGLMKKWALRQVPPVIRCKSRRLFYGRKG